MKTYKANRLKVTRVQFHVGLKLYQWNGNPLEPQVQTVIDSLPEPQKTVAETKFQQANEYKRADQMLIQLAGALGMTDSDIDNFFQFCKNEAWEQ